MAIVSEMKLWRGRQARKEGVEVFRVLPNRTLEEIARLLPKTREELLDIHGIGEKKVEKYGEEILEIVRNAKLGTQDAGTYFSGDSSSAIRVPDAVEDISQKVVSVGEFLDRTNAVLAEMPASIRGEVSSADVRERYVFFTIKDGEDNASLSVFMWRREYDMCGVCAQEGVEVIVRGRLEVYKPSGRLSFRAHAMELVGEGAIKAAYDRLKKKLEEEGLFSPEKKRVLREFPHRVGIITSREGAVIHDFMSNIGRFGFDISFVNSRVEGALAVTEIVRAMRILKTHPIDVLVMIRGGGSLESLAAFNNETIVREIADFPVPVICGIGHDKDVPLASLAADVMVSTPTAVTRELNASWEKALGRVNILERDLINFFERRFVDQQRMFQKNTRYILLAFSDIVTRYRNADERFRNCFSLVQFSCSRILQKIINGKKTCIVEFDRLAKRASEKLNASERTLSQGDPRKQLQLGYGIISHKGKIVRSVGDVVLGEEISVVLSDGTVDTRVQKTHFSTKEKI